MRLLVDTQAFLWFVAGDSRLSRAARRAIEDPDAELYVSAASVWEMAIKSSLGRVTLPEPVADYIASKAQSGVRMLSIDWWHAAAVETLPFHHRDPFDRLLAAQARLERLAIVTNDRLFRRYGVQVIW